MLLFDWSRIDWIKWMPYEILFLLFLIIILRIIRRSQRWGPIQLNNIDTQNFVFDQVHIPCHLKNSFSELPQNIIISKKSVKNYSSSNTKRLLFIPPIFARIDDKYVLSVSLAQLDWDIITISFKNLKKILNTTKNPSEQLAKLLAQLEISTIILFDYSISPILNILNDIINQEKNLNINCILIRPTINWDHIAPFWHLIPFSSQWFTRIRMYFNRNWISSIEKKIKRSKKDELEFPPNLNFYAIQSNKSWLSSLGKQKLLIWNKNNIADLNAYSIKINKGNWNFFRNETILIGFISQFLDIINKRNNSN